MSLYDNAWSGRLVNASAAERWWREFRMVWVGIAEMIRASQRR